MSWKGELSANWTGSARYGWTLSYGPNTFSLVREWLPGTRADSRAVRGKRMTGLSDAERDASEVVQALVGLAALLRRPVTEPSRWDEGEPPMDETRRLLLSIAEDSGQAASRVLAYLRELRGAGDGELAAVPPRLGPWREWTPPRGHLFGVSAPVVRRSDEVPQPRRCDPGE